MAFIFVFCIFEVLTYLNCDSGKPAVAILTMFQREGRHVKAEQQCSTNNLLKCTPVHPPLCRIAAPCLLSSPNSKVSEHEPRTTLLLFLSLGLAPTPGLLAPPCQSGPDPVQAPHENPLPVKVLTSNKTYVGKFDVIFAGTSITTRANPAHPWL